MVHLGQGDPLAAGGEGGAAVDLGAVRVCVRRVHDVGPLRRPALEVGARPPADGAAGVVGAAPGHQLRRRVARPAELGEPPPEGVPGEAAAVRVGGHGGLEGAVESPAPAVGGGAAHEVLALQALQGLVDLHRAAGVGGDDQLVALPVGHAGAGILDDAGEVDEAPPRRGEDGVARQPASGGQQVQLRLLPADAVAAARVGDPADLLGAGVVPHAEEGVAAAGLRLVQDRPREVDLRFLAGAAEEGVGRVLAQPVPAAGHVVPLGDPLVVEEEPGLAELDGGGDPVHGRRHQEESGRWVSKNRCQLPYRMPEISSSP